MDIDPARLKVAEIMANRMIAALGVKAKVVATLDQRVAIKGARYVICTVQVGGYEPGTVIDFEIPRKYGLLQTIGDTLGVGGIFRALRTIPVMTEIARNIAELGAPGCLLLNYTNPMAMNCTAVARATGIPHIGLCHSVQGTSRQLATYAGLPYEDITYLVAGINHMAFFLKFKYRGQDAYPFLFNLLEKPDFKQDRVRFEMMRRTGYFVTESSEHQSEYVPYFIHHGKKMIEQFEVPIDEYLRRCQAGLRTWKQTEDDLLGRYGKIAVNPQSHEYGSFIIHSRETNTPRVIYGNVPNTGLIDNLPSGVCVELPCLGRCPGHPANPYRDAPSTARCALPDQYQRSDACRRSGTDRQARAYLPRRHARSPHRDRSHPRQDLGHVRRTHSCAPEAWPARQFRADHSRHGARLCGHRRPGSCRGGPQSGEEKQERKSGS